MITEFDEAHYHEMIVHVPMAYLPKTLPLNVLIIGGGDGGTLREVLRHRNVVHVTMVEYDPNVVAMAVQQFPKVLFFVCVFFTLWLFLDFS